MPETHVSEQKKRIVEKFAKLIKEYPVIGAVNMANMPAPQLQVMRGQLRDTVVIKMTRTKLMKHAIEQCKADKKNIEKIEEYIGGLSALLFTKENPFKLCKFIQKNKSPAPAKPGQTSPKDIIIPAGPTQFTPGPIISELGGFGIKTAVENGKIAVKEDKVVVKKGDIIDEKMAGLLSKFNIKPIEVGLDITAIYEDGVIYKKDILEIDEEQFMNNLKQAGLWAINLAVESDYFTKDTVELLIPKAFNEAKALALEANIMCDLIAEQLVEKAERQMMGLKAAADISDVIGKKKEKVEEEARKEEPKAEEKIEEKKAEEKEEIKEEKKEKVEEEPKAEEKPAEKVEETKEEKKEKIEKKPAEVPEEVREEVKIGERDEEESREIAEDIKEIDKKIEKEVEEIKTEVKEEIKEINKDIKEEQKKEVPDIENLQMMEKELGKIDKDIQETEEIKKEAEEIKKEATGIQKVKQLEKTLEKIEEKVQDIPKAEDLAKQKKQQEITKEEPEPVPTTIKKEEFEESSRLFEELKKKGTLRGVGKEEEKIPEEKSPRDIIKEHIKKLKEKK